MSFKGDGQKFIGDDGYLEYAEEGATVIGDGATALPVGTYIVTKVAAASTLPGAVSGGLPTSVGDILKIEGTTSITPAVGDNLVTLILTAQCDVKDWRMQFTKAEVNTSTICDNVETYRAGKSDMQGNINGVYTVGTTDAIDGPLQRFIDLAKQDSDVSFDRFVKDGKIMLGFFYLNNDVNIADKEYVVAAIELFGASAGGEQGNASTFESGFRFGNLSITDSNGDSASVTPTHYRLGSA
jgi:hypothetical protein